MTAYSIDLLRTRVGRPVVLFRQPPRSRRRKSAQVRQLAGDEGANVILRLHGQEYPFHVDVGINEPVWATREGYWWEFSGPSLPHAREPA